MDFFQRDAQVWLQGDEYLLQAPTQSEKAGRRAQASQTLKRGPQPILIATTLLSPRDDWYISITAYIEIKADESVAQIARAVVDSVEYQ